MGVDATLVEKADDVGDAVACCARGRASAPARAAHRRTVTRRGRRRQSTCETSASSSTASSRSTGSNGGSTPASAGSCSGPTARARRRWCASCRCTCTRHAARSCVLGAVLGRVDIRKVRPRIGIASASMAAMLRRELEVIDVVMTAERRARAVVAHATPTTIGLVRLLDARPVRDARRSRGACSARSRSASSRRCSSRGR